MRGIVFLVVVVAAAVLGFLGLTQAKYGTGSACTAASEAIRAEAPEILAKAAEKDPGFGGLAAAGTFFPRLGEAIAEASGQRASLELSERTAADCVFLVLYREVDVEGFRELAADRLLEKRPQLGPR